MVLLISASKAQKKLSEYAKERRLAMGLTQEGLSLRAGVALPTLRKFEQKGSISLASFLKLMLVLDGLEDIVQSCAPKKSEFASIDDVLQADKQEKPKRGWRK